MIHALLIDLDGVIRVWDEGHGRSIEQCFGLPQGIIDAIAFSPSLLGPAITGKISDELWRDRIERRLAEQFPGSDAAAVIQRWSVPAGRVDQQALALVRRCRQHIPVGLITNATSRLLRDLERLQLSDEFDVIINSSVVGSAKPDREIFQFAVDALHAPPSTTLFVDDTPGHVRAACGFGIHGHVYRDARDFQKLLEQYRVVDPLKFDSPAVPDGRFPDRPA